VKWIRTYHAAATTPLEPDDILFGKLRGSRRERSSRGPVHGHHRLFRCHPIVVVSDAAFIGTLVTLASRRHSSPTPQVSIRRFVHDAVSLRVRTHVSLFGDFYPLSEYPLFAPVVQFFPLYHGVALHERRRSDKVHCSAVRSRRSLGAMAVLGSCGDAHDASPLTD